MPNWDQFPWIPKHSNLKQKKKTHLKSAQISFPLQTLCLGHSHYALLSGNVLKSILNKPLHVDFPTSINIALVFWKILTSLTRQH